jgi:cysteinyl-tRNA synthetase
MIKVKYWLYTHMVKAGVKKMSKLFCSNTETVKGRLNLQKSVERLIKENQKVFDNLAKS